MESSPGGAMHTCPELLCWRVGAHPQRGTQYCTDQENQAKFFEDGFSSARVGVWKSWRHQTRERTVHARGAQGNQRKISTNESTNERTYDTHIRRHDDFRHAPCLLCSSRTTVVNILSWAKYCAKKKCHVLVVPSAA